ncbi:hypothetical protein [Cupriavidus basilensis]|nr:hypothetical protein [Cupriavidus basilensis]
MSDTQPKPHYDARLLRAVGRRVNMRSAAGCARLRRLGQARRTGR